MTTMIGKLNKRFSTNTAAMLDNSISDIKKMYTDFSKKVLFSRQRSQTFDLAEIQQEAARENGKLTKNHSLLYACIRGNLEEVKQLLMCDEIDVNYSNHESTALHKAAEYGYAPICKLLIDHGAELDPKNSEGLTPLSIAVSHAHIDTLGVLLRYGANPTIMDNLKQSPLHHAARYANIDILMVLLGKFVGLDISLQSIHGFTPLHSAVCSDNIDCVNVLIEKGGGKLVNVVSFVDPNMERSTQGTTAFHLAAEFGFADCFMACTKVEGIDLWQKNTAGRTPLHLACKNGHAPIVEHILSKLPNKYDALSPMFFDERRNTPLHYAALSRNPRCITLLMNKLQTSSQGKMTDWDCPNIEKEYPIHLSCENNNVDSLKELLIHKLQYNQRNTDQETPLYIAVTRGYRNCVGLLLQAGATFTDMNANKLLKFEESGNKIRIDAGTLRELVDHAITHGSTDEDFRKTFFIIYKCFTTSVELVEEIRERLTANWINADFVKMAVKTIEFWITNHSRDFRADKVLLERTNQILKEIANKPGLEMAGKQLQSLLAKKAQGPVTKRQREISRMLSQGFFTEDNGQLFSVTKSTKVVQQLCLIEYDIYYAIKKEELFHAAWNHKHKEQESPNVLVFINRFEQVSKWVRGIILKAEKISFRIKLLLKCIKVALKCFDLHNYTTVMQIVAALESAPISRLKNTWAKIPEKTIQKYKQICQVMLPAANYKNYRAQIATVEPPCVPYIGTFLTDLTFIDEGNPDFIAEGSTRLINYKKFHMIAELIQRLQKFQRIGYTFTLDNDLKKYLLQCQVVMDDNQAYKQSLLINPKLL